MTTQVLQFHPLRQRRYWLPLAIVVFAVQIPFMHHYFRGAREVTQGVPFQDTFDRAALGDDYWANGGGYRLVDGHLYLPGAGHNPLWLKARLPDDAQISFDAWSDGPRRRHRGRGLGRRPQPRHRLPLHVRHLAQQREPHRQARGARADHRRSAHPARLAGAAVSHPRRRNRRAVGLDGAAARHLVGAARSRQALEPASYFKRETPFAVRKAARPGWCAGSTTTG